MVREYKIEQYAVKELEALGAWPIKLTSSMCRGLPDRMIIFPNGYILFVEFKRSKRKVFSPLQKIQIKKLREIKQKVVLINSFYGVDCMIEEARQKGWFDV
jgi:Holliday junction resolvase-like predicted endonuclease